MGVLLESWACEGFILPQQALRGKGLGGVLGFRV